MIEMMEADPLELSGEKELPTRVLRRLEGLMAFISTWESELTTTKRRTVQEGIRAEKQQENPLTPQADSINKLCVVGYWQSSKMVYFATYLTSPETGKKATRLNGNNQNRGKTRNDKYQRPG